jgi:hypothetical protein
MTGLLVPLTEVRWKPRDVTTRDQFRQGGAGLSSRSPRWNPRC